MIVRPVVAALVVCTLAAAADAAAQAPAARKINAAAAPNYVIGPDDVLSVVFWRDKDMSADVVVRPDGVWVMTLLAAEHSDAGTFQSFAAAWISIMRAVAPPLRT